MYLVIEQITSKSSLIFSSIYLQFLYHVSRLRILPNLIFKSNEVCNECTRLIISNLSSVNGYIRLVVNLNLVCGKESISFNNDLLSSNITSPPARCTSFTSGLSFK